MSTITASPGPRTYVCGVAMFMFGSKDSSLLLKMSRPKTLRLFFSFCSIFFSSIAVESGMKPLRASTPSLKLSSSPLSMRRLSSGYISSLPSVLSEALEEPPRMEVPFAVRLRLSSAPPFSEEAPRLLFFIFAYFLRSCWSFVTLTPFCISLVTICACDVPFFCSFVT